MSGVAWVPSDRTPEAELAGKLKDLRDRIARGLKAPRLRAEIDDLRRKLPSIKAHALKFFER